jgi:hypothetical protein
MRPGAISLCLTLSLAPPLLAGCGVDAPFVTEGVLLASGASLPVFHRTPLDMLVSAASGRDCSVVHLDRVERYCHPKERPPEQPVFCTRSLGVADCWEDPSHLPNKPREIADGPRSLTPDQDADRKKRWPGLW